MAKTLLLLGGTRFALPVIKSAHDLGVKVITCDYLPDNYAHAYSDGYVNASIVDNEAVLAVAESVKADGIMSFAADPGVVSAAFVAEKLGLPFQGSFEAVSILQDKERFRSFLRDNGFNCPSIHVFSSSSDAVEHSDEIEYPVIVKPVDSAGSKGCSRVDSPKELKKSVDYALEHSRDGRCIVEQFIEKQYESSGADAFLLDDTFSCVSYTSQLFDLHSPNKFVPAAHIMPSFMPITYQCELNEDLQRLANLLKLQNGIFNIETRVSIDNKPYIMEVSPRGGGNRLAEMLKYATGGRIDLIKASVQAALGMDVDCVSDLIYDGYWYLQVLHSEKTGIYQGIKYEQSFRDAHVIEEQIWVDPGDYVESFDNAGNTFGSIFLRFDTKEGLERFMDAPQRFMQIMVS